MGLIFYMSKVGEDTNSYLHCYPKNCGLTTILIPKQNVKDVDDIPKEVRDKLTIIPVENVSDVFAQALIR